MDQSALVSSGQKLVRLMDQAGIVPRAAMWMHNIDTDTWRLWVVPPPHLTDKRDFYRRIAEMISGDRAGFQNLEIGDVEMVSEAHPAIMGLTRMFRVEGLSSVHVSNNKFNDFYMPDGIILRMAA